VCPSGSPDRPTSTPLPPRNASLTCIARATGRRGRQQDFRVRVPSSAHVADFWPAPRLCPTVCRCIRVSGRAPPAKFHLLARLQTLARRPPPPRDSRGRRQWLRLAGWPAGVELDSRPTRSSADGSERRAPRGPPAHCEPGAQGPGPGPAAGPACPHGKRGRLEDGADSRIFELESQRLRMSPSFGPPAGYVPPSADVCGSSAAPRRQSYTSWPVCRRPRALSCRPVCRWLKAPGSTAPTASEPGGRGLPPMVSEGDWKTGQTAGFSS
jgi:hypothetical protein